MSDPPHDLTPLMAFLKQAAPRGRQMLLPSLHHAQSLYGWLPREVQEQVGLALRVPLAEIHGVVEFYSMFYNHPTPRRVIRLCEDPACSLAGSERVAAAVEQQLGLSAQGNGSPDLVELEKVPCLGMCEHAPAGLNGERSAGSLSEESAGSFLAGELPEVRARVFGEQRLLLGRLGVVDPGSLEDYEAHGGYQGLRKALATTPEAVIEAVDECRILGRGGAMFPLGKKWLFTRQAPGAAAEKHIIVNADESEPGTFKDRCILEEDPFSVIEAATLAGYAVGAERGWIFLRGEYPRAYSRLELAVRKARQAGYLGKDILGSVGFNFDLELRLGAGAYICGEETALFEAIEGRRGFPRIKPPFPTTNGLFHQPTAINNVETLAAALVAYRLGAAQWRRYGTPESPGTKLFCLSGQVATPGLYEVPFGITLQGLIDMAGGESADDGIQAVLMGGAAGIFLGPDQLDIPLTYEDARQKDIPLGSGVVMVFGRDVDLRRPLYELSRFFAHESCGKCYPCQLGTQRQMEILDRAAGGTVFPGDRQALQDIGHAMTCTSLCGLGQTAASAVLSAVEIWPELIA